MNDKPKTFLYCRTAERIKDLILAEQWNVGSYLPSERKLTADLGVAFLTVRKALALLAAEGIIVKCPSRGNQIVALPPPSPPPSGLRRKRVGVTIWGEAGINHPATVHLLSLSGDHLPADQYEVVILFINNRMLETGRWETLLNPDMLDGMLVTVQEIPPEILAKLQQLPIPVVFSGFPETTPGGWCDCLAGLENLFNYLISLGHRDLAFISGSGKSQAVRHEMAFFEHCCRKNGLPFHENTILAGDFSEQSGYRNMLKLLQGGQPPSAVLAGDDYMALGALKALEEAGLECPRDISLVCFEGCFLAERLSPPLTVLSNQRRDLSPSVRCIEMLKELIEGRSRDRKQFFTYSPELIIRRSTAVKSFQQK